MHYLPHTQSFLPVVKLSFFLLHYFFFVSRIPYWHKFESSFISSCTLRLFAWFYTYKVRSCFKRGARLCVYNIEHFHRFTCLQEYRRSVWRKLCIESMTIHTFPLLSGMREIWTLFTFLSYEWMYHLKACKTWLWNFKSFESLVWR